MKRYMIVKGTRLTPDHIPEYCWNRERKICSISNNHFSATYNIKETIVDEWFFTEDDILFIYPNEFLVRLPTFEEKFNCFWIKTQTAIQY